MIFVGLLRFLYNFTKLNVLQIPEEPVPGVPPRKNPTVETLVENQFGCLLAYLAMCVPGLAFIGVCLLIDFIIKTIYNWFQ